MNTDRNARVFVWGGTYFTALADSAVPGVDYFIIIISGRVHDASCGGVRLEGVGGLGWGEIKWKTTKGSRTGSEWRAAAARQRPPRSTRSGAPPRSRGAWTVPWSSGSTELETASLELIYLDFRRPPPAGLHRQSAAALFGRGPETAERLPY